MCAVEQASTRGSRTHAERLAARDGYFGPESVIRRMGNSPLTPLLSGGAAVLLQVAHPLVACGVVEHSGYDRDLSRRLIGTLRALYLIAFGDKAEAEQAGAAVRRAHGRVRGTTATQLGPFPAGTHYREFQDYVEAQLASRTITVTAPAREVASVIVAAPLPLPLRILVPAHRLATTKILPPRLRDEYELRWTALHELALPFAARTLRYGTRPVLAVAARIRR
jgi:uncharacterized protein (DUF2236 family)